MLQRVRYIMQMDFKIDKSDRDTGVIMLEMPSLESLRIGVLRDGGPHLVEWESFPHVTILYDVIDTGDIPVRTKKFVESLHKTVPVHIQNWDTFDNDTKVLYLKVANTQTLSRVRDLAMDVFDYGPKATAHGDYKPHVTCGYFDELHGDLPTFDEMVVSASSIMIKI